MSVDENEILMLFEHASKSEKHVMTPTGFQGAKFLDFMDYESPGCHDRVKLWMYEASSNMVNFRFQHVGCATSRVSTHCLCEFAVHHNELVVLTDGANVISALQGKGLNSHKYDDLSLAALGNIHVYPAKHKCAVFPWLMAIRMISGWIERRS